MDSFFRADPAIERPDLTPARPPHSSRPARLGVLALFCGLIPVAAGVLLIAVNAGPPVRSPPGTIVITPLEAISLLLYFIGAPVGGMAALVFAACASYSAAGRAEAGGAEAGRSLSFYAVASTLLGWGLCACILVYVMSRHPQK